MADKTRFFIPGAPDEYRASMWGDLPEAERPTITSTSARDAFAAALGEHHAANAVESAAFKALDAAYAADMIREAMALRKKGSRRKIETLNDAADILGDAFKALQAPWFAKGAAMSADHNTAGKAREASLCQLAEAAEVHPGEQRLVYADEWSSSYRTTCRGAYYAQQNAESSADTPRQFGVRVEIEPYWFDGDKRDPYDPAGYRACVFVESALDIEILKRKPGLTMREWVRSCWKRGVNPRVMQPFLPHGYEERVGLDYFGNDLRASPAAGERDRVCKGVEAAYGLAWTVHRHDSGDGPDGHCYQATMAHANGPIVWVYASETKLVFRKRTGPGSDEDAFSREERAG